MVWYDKQQIGDCTLYLGDCMDVMPTLGEVDAVICDPPYGTTACKWDSVIPLEKMWEALNVCTNKHTPFVFTSSQPFTSALVMSNPKLYKYDWVWKKPKGTGHLNAKKMPMRDKEDVLVFYNKQPTYNPQFEVGKPYKNKAGDPEKSTSMTDSYGNYTNFRYDNEGKRYPKQVLELPVVERDTVHPTQKPIDLMKYFIKTYTNKGDLVLDFAMGSGTTGVACADLGRRFIGIELEQKYFNAAYQRISQTDSAPQQDDFL